MPRVEQHLVASFLPDQSKLTVQQVNAANYTDSFIVIKMLSAGVCGTDLAMISGSRICHTDVLGHEGVGVIVYSPKSSSFVIGTRVIINPVHKENPRVVIGHSMNGIFREIFCIDSSTVETGNLLLACPRNCALGNLDLVLVEPLASVLYSLELLKVIGLTSLLIRGSGTVAILAAKVWSQSFGSSATLISQSEKHAQWLRASVAWPNNVNICFSADFINRNKESDCAILCCSRETAPEGLNWLLDNLRDGATIDLMAGFPTEYREPRLGEVSLDAIRGLNVCGVNSVPPVMIPDLLTGKTVNLVGHRGTSTRHILGAIDLLSSGDISLADIPHRIFNLSELPGAVNTMLSRERDNAKFVKAIVDFSSAPAGEATEFN